jgi:DNA-directed RNA polymerase subunit RPC12/RpoP
MNLRQRSEPANDSSPTWTDLVMRCPVCIVHRRDPGAAVPWALAQCGGKLQVSDAGRIRCPTCGRQEPACCRHYSHMIGGANERKVGSAECESLWRRDTGETSYSYFRQQQPVATTPDTSASGEYRGLVIGTDRTRELFIATLWDRLTLMGTWTKLWRCNGCNNINPDSTYVCAGCGRSSSEVGYTTVYKCGQCGNLVSSSANSCPRCGNA